MPINHREWNRRPGFVAGVFEQYTDFGTLQRDGHSISNPGDQRLSSSLTQVFLGYNFNQDFGLQLNVPYLYRRYRRTGEDGGIESGNVSGLGDVSLMLQWTPLRLQRGDFVAQATIGGGIKFPTGDAGRLREDASHGSHGGHGEEHAEEGHEEHGDHGHGNHEEHPTAIHGHELALGSGSIDGMLTGSFVVRYKNFFYDGAIQYAIRGQGDFDYRFANDVYWSTGPGLLLVANDQWSVTLQAVVSGQHKGEDSVRGKKFDHTAFSNIYVGPKAAVTWNNRLTADVGLEIPVHRDNSGVQVVPDYRLRATLSWAF